MSPEEVQDMLEGGLRRTGQDLRYQDPRWLKCRAKIIKRDGGVCRRCPSKKVLQVHHIKYIGTHLWDTPAKWLITLCKVCHEKEHRK